MENLNNPFVKAFCFASISVVLSYIENKVNNSGRNKNDYIKMFLIVFFIIIACSFSGNASLETYKNQDFLTGNPDF